ncbi:MAG: alpha/beta hydrolase-fold protein [Woeseiaceae bacterium]|nr:alpha/beta hydrolase-fold protein [Woeseiaceae bacterium]
MTDIETVEIETGTNPDGSIIWLHGLGADGHDFEPIVPELRLPANLSLRFVFPHAPVRPVTINGGTAMRAWYDIYSLDRGGPVDEQGIRDSGEIANALIARERERGIASDRIVLAGFSQGGAIALHAALRYPVKLAGLMALSTYLPLWSSLDGEVIDNPAAVNKDIPIFMAHGTFDPVLPMQMGSGSRDLLRDRGLEIEWREYPMAHAVCAEEIAHIRDWLVGVFDAAE